MVQYQFYAPNNLIRYGKCVFGLGKKIGTSVNPYAPEI